MRALSCEAPGRLAFVERPEPERRPGEALVRILKAGVCGTDLHIFAGNQPYFEYPRVIGHELSAEVIEAEPGSGLAPGDLVAINPYLACGDCHACRIGKTNCCARLKVLGVHTDGGLCERLSLPVGNLHPVDGLTAEQAAMIEFLAVGAHAVARTRIAPGARVLVTGGGPIGIAAALFAKLDGGEVTVTDMRADRLDFCREALGVGTLAAGPEARAEMEDRTGGEFYGAVFDATGSPKAMEAGFLNVANGGSYTLLSIVKADITFPDPEFHRRETTLYGSRNALPADFERVIAAMRSGDVPWRELVTHRVPLDALPERMGGLSDPATGAIKALVEIS